MAVLHWLEGIRTPFLDAFFLLVTQLGEEVIFTVLIIGTLWCVNKRAGFWMFFSWGCGTGINQFVKAAARVPRPWVRDASLAPVERAIAEAGGYSFPSGHTQSALGLFGSLSVFARKRWVWIVSAVLVALTGFSRLYLGVHTPADVIGAVLIGVCIVAGMQWMANREAQWPWISWVACGVLLAVTGGLLIYAELADTGADRQLHEAAENGWKLFGAALGLTVAWQLDRYVVHFDTRAVWWVQLCKFTVGVAGALGIQQGLKTPLLRLFSGHFAAHGVRYLLIALFAGFLYPLTFPLWKRLEQRHRKGERQ